MARRHLLTPSLLLISLELLTGSLLIAADQNDYKSGIELQQGYRRERFDFLAGAKHSKEGIRTKLHSRHIDVHSSRLQWRGVSNDGIFLQAFGGYGHILRGRVDFAEHMKGRHGRDVSFHASKDYTMDLGLFLGKEFRNPDGWLMAPRIGYSFYRQKIGLKNARLKDSHDRKVHGLHAKYKADWYSPQLGVRLEKTLSDSCSLYGDYSFLWPMKYRGSGTSNRHSNDGVQFHNRAKQWHSWGHIGYVGSKFTFNPNWSLNLEYELSKFFAKKGHQSWHHERQPLHKAHRSTQEIRLALCYNF